MSDHRDLALAMLADDLAVVTARAIAAESERDAYRDLSQVGIHHAHDLQEQIARFQRTNQHLREQLRALGSEQRQVSGRAA